MSIYLYIWLISPLKGDSKDNGLQRDSILLPSYPCPFMGENTEEGVSRSLALSLFVAFHYPQGIQW